MSENLQEVWEEPCGHLGRIKGKSKGKRPCKGTGLSVEGRPLWLEVRKQEEEEEEVTVREERGKMEGLVGPGQSSERGGGATGRCYLEDPLLAEMKTDKYSLSFFWGFGTAHSSTTPKRSRQAWQLISAPCGVGWAAQQVLELPRWFHWSVWHLRWGGSKEQLDSAWATLLQVRWYGKTVKTEAPGLMKGYVQQSQSVPSATC